MLSWVKNKKWLVVNALLVGVLLSALGVQVVDRDQAEGRVVKIGIGNEKVITLGHVAYAAGSVDYTYDGAADNVQFQAALNALPATGGRLVDVSAVQKNFAATVTRAINNVVIEGAGFGSYFANNGVTALFTAGGNGWKFSDLRTDAGGISMGATTGWQWINVNDGSGTVYDLRTPAGSIVNGSFTASTITSTVATGTSPLTVTSTTKVSNLNTDLVDGYQATRGAAYTIAAVDSPAIWKAQADEVLDGVDDHVQIQAALDAYHDVLLAVGTFTGEQINMDSDERISGASEATILKAENAYTVADDDQRGMIRATSGAYNIVIENMTIDGNSSGGANVRAIMIKGVGVSTNDSEQIGALVRNVKAQNTSGDAFRFYLSYFVKLYDSEALHTSGDGVELDNTYHSVISNFIVADSSCFGVNLTLSQFNVVTGIKIKNNDAEGVDGPAGGIVLHNNSHYNTISDSQVWGSHQTLEGVTLSAANYNTITGVQIYDVREYGIGLGDGVGAGTAPAIANTITGNVVYSSTGATKWGVKSYDINSTRNVISNNVFYQTTYPAVYGYLTNSVITGNTIYYPAMDASDAYSGINSVTGEGDNAVVTGNIIVPHTNTKYGISMSGTGINVSDNQLTGTYVTAPMSIGFLSTGGVAKNNIGFIVPGEIRTSSGSLTAGNANAIAFSWNNPEAQDILVKKVVVDVTTGGGTAGSHLDVGIADDATGTNRGTEFFNDLLLENISINDSWVAGDGGTQTKWVFQQDNASATDDWIVGQILDANAAALVGRWYVEYAGR